MQVLRATALAVALSAIASAGPIVLTFEGLQNEEEVLNYYNGGMGGSGSGPGPSDGITFSANSLALTEGNFSNPPSGDTILFFSSGTGDTMDVAGGFTTGFSFYYSAPIDTGTVNVYSGLDGTGTLLASINLALTQEEGPGCSADFCPFVPIGVNFSGTAESVNFGGTGDEIGFDDITIGSATADGGSAPEPGAIMLVGLGLASLVFLQRRRSARANSAAPLV